MLIRVQAIALILAAAAACGGASHGAGDDGSGGADARVGSDGGRPRDADRIPTDRGPRGDTGETVVRDSGPPPPPVLCGGSECSDDESCCTETGRCYDTARPEDCELTTPPPPESGSGVPCASSADCAATEFCRVPDGSCIGAGWCYGRDHEGLVCRESPGVCACDGRTYATTCDAYEAGVTVSRAGMTGPCGSSEDPLVVRCGRDTDCPTGRTCCARTNVCVDPASPESCAPAPPGTLASCASDADCRFLDGRGGSDNHYCFGTGCGAAETSGGCVYFGGDRCTGELIPVCGCDGISYTNVCWAIVARTRIAHDGECP